MKPALIVVAMVAALDVIATAAPTAEALYNEGQAAYDRTDYPAAIAKWQASYELSGASGLLFNLAQAYRLSGDCEHALANYKQFVAIDPSTEQRPLAEEFVRELEPKCGTPTPVPIIDRPLANAGRTKKLAALATGGAGLVLFATGLGLGHHASVLGDEVTAACIPSMPCPWASWKSKDAAGRRDAAIGYTLDGLGIAAIVGGAITYYLGRRRNIVTILPRPAEGGAVVTWSGAW